MLKRNHWLLFALLLVILAGCGFPPAPYTATPEPTPIEDGTPTVEAPAPTLTPQPTPTWERPEGNLDDGGGCLKPEELELVVNWNPCLAGSEVQVIGDYTMVHPRGMPYRAYRGITGQWGTNVSLGSAFDIDIGYYAGSIGMLGNDILLERDTCYIADAWYEVRVFSDTEPNTSKLNQNYTVNVALHLDTGRVVYLNQQNLGVEIHNPDTSVVWDLGQFPGSERLRHRIFPFWTNIDGLSAKPEALVNALFPLARHESTISYVIFAIKKMPEAGGTGHCQEIRQPIEWRPLISAAE